MAPAASICAICGAKYAADALFCPKDGAPLGAAAPKGKDPYLGLELPGPIRIEQLIGIGSMGRVYLGFQAGINRRVAVKLLHKELSANRTLVARFHREAEIISRLSHPGVVQIFMAGQLPEGPPGDGAMYIVMEHLDGISLRSALAAAGGAIPLVRALRIALQMCEAIGEAHVLGIVHRDVKPENIMLTRRSDEGDIVRVLDFGIARSPGGNTQTVTKAGLIFGTARYISPEGAAGTPVGPPADVYAIATILYQMLAGRTPFSGDSAVEVLGMQINQAPPPLRSIERASYVPEPIAAAIMRGLAKHPEQREPDAQAFGRAIAQAARAGGLAPEDLVPRSPLLGMPGKRPAFASVEATKQLALQPSDVAAPNVSPESVEGAPSVERPPLSEPLPPAKKSGGRALAFLIGCALGGVALAALGARGSVEPSPNGTTSAGPADAGPEEASAPR
jgi:serine/threonine-protein kinase